MINKYEQWLKLTINDIDTNSELLKIQGDLSAIEDRFYNDLEFGTGGLRGKIGAGTNRMNVYTVSRITKGLSRFMRSVGKSFSAVIAYDSRYKSKLFAQTAAGVLASSGIKVFFFDSLTATPILSFAVRHLGADFGIVITASHNPQEYNGYKVYDNTGCQICTKTAEKIGKIIKKSDYFYCSENYSRYLSHGKIQLIGDDITDLFINKTITFHSPSSLKIVFTPLCGTGNIPINKALTKAGFKDILTVKEQQLPDESFKTCPSPNPENLQSFDYAIKLAKEQKSELVIATDPDCDRVGVAVLHGGNYVFLNGNEIGTLLCYYILSKRKSENSLPENPLIITTVVSSIIPEKIVKSFGGSASYVLTGFKNIGEKINRLERSGNIGDFVLGMEESLGYLTNTLTRDKDGVSSSLVIAQMTDYYKGGDKTLVDILEEIYKKYGYFDSRLVTYTFEGEEGAKKISAVLTKLRAAPLEKLNGNRLKSCIDYLTIDDDSLKTNMIEYNFGKLKVIIRPSGTEPKLKIYIQSTAENQDKCSMLLAQAANELEKIIN